ncbi:uncharacterized protein LOC124500660 [Dermatophagoides farinae]|uniref:uncharacterized protein LOC124500660 n=1 Tax=Dermatophagoides farinae TaxID=6954 RepID=UPI003F6393F3
MVSTSTPKPSVARSTRSRTPSRIPTPAIKKSKYSIMMTSTPIQMKQTKKKSKSSTKKEWTKTPYKKSDIIGSAQKKSNKKPQVKKRKSIVVVDDDVDMDNDLDEYRPSKKSAKKTPSKTKKTTDNKSIISPVIEFNDDDNDVYEEHLYEKHDSNTGLSTPSSLVRRSKRIRQHHHQHVSALNSIMEEQSNEYKNDTNQSINGQSNNSNNNNNNVADKWSSWLSCTVM